MSIHTIIVDGYNVKYNYNGSIAKVSIPNYSCTMDLSAQSHHFDTIFTTQLMDLGWTVAAIAILEDHIIANDNEWFFCYNMNNKTGEMQMV